MNTLFRQVYEYIGQKELLLAINSNDSKLINKLA